MTIWAVLPVKEMVGAKERLSPLLSPEERVALMRVMVGEVLAALSAARGLAGITVVTLDPWATAAAQAAGARVITAGAREGHTGSVTTAARLLEAEGASGILTMPGDIPAVTAAEVEALLTGHGAAPAFSIAPSHDEGGSNGVLLSPAAAVPLRFGEDSFFPHLAAGPIVRAKITASLGNSSACTVGCLPASKRSKRLARSSRSCSRSRI